jgi:hypothetical protein
VCSSDLSEESTEPHKGAVKTRPEVSPAVDGSPEFPAGQTGTPGISPPSGLEIPELPVPKTGLPALQAHEISSSQEPGERPGLHPESVPAPEPSAHEEQKAMRISAALQQLSGPSGWVKPGPVIPADVDTVNEVYSCIRAEESPAAQTGIEDEIPSTGMSPVHEAQPDAGTDLPVPESSSPFPQSPASPGTLLQKKQIAVIVVSVVVILLAILAVLVMSPLVLPGDHGNQTPGINTTPAIQQSLAPAPVVIPATGTWVRVRYNGTYIGYVGNPGSMQPVSGTGDQIFVPLRNYELIQASIQKQDYSGETLTVDVYSHGQLIAERTTRVPHATIDILLDTRTGKAPGIVTTYG